jgi:hypothetical protein
MKIDKEYTLGDNTVNEYGFRLLTSGFQVEEFKKNPIGYYEHVKEGGVLVRWDDLRIDSDKIYARPIINTANPRGSQTIEEVKNHFLNAASFGKLVILEFTDDAEFKLPGQTGLTVTKWYARECSLVGIPGNYNALAKIDLSDIEFGNINLSALFGSMNLSTRASDVDADINGLLSTAVQDYDITSSQAEILKNQYPPDKAGPLKALLQEMSKMRIRHLMSFSFDELDKKGLLEELKGKFYDGLQIKFIQRFGKQYTGKKETSTKSLSDKETNAVLLQYAIDAGYLTEGERVGLESMAPTDEVLKTRIMDLIERGYKEVSEGNWNDLEKAGKLDVIKFRMPLQYARLYRDKFGVDYCED